MRTKYQSLTNDVGYGGIKAVSSDGKRASYPSVLALVREDDLGGIFDGEGHTRRATIYRTGPER
ncbi:hypothetical protein Psch_03502 [Pelotomaculum schinkii]|uniref:Uncharacterized protein n=1 Tax=Pelotomaculum schinkii TaxID=78350 RepID=A0A4Y7R7Y0_9FIRM|nr:hypothetical protein [Pelotomaculum schinkii]TEB04740.1 hypothetical protein Psch_03502 [Pelotomaculum schinkii]